ncbi:MAG: hypothetical protein QG629_286 [Patescibacteria group bacterium]|nr:hypothetical protein [Candidatus Saccharibacteria bacterium]MDQ5963204.1 hypothetical protein [Patescibacteria group bacterium]
MGPELKGEIATSLPILQEELSFLVAAVGNEQDACEAALAQEALAKLAASIVGLRSLQRVGSTEEGAHTAQHSEQISQQANNEPNQTENKEKRLYDSDLLSQQQGLLPTVAEETTVVRGVSKWHKEAYDEAMREPDYAKIQQILPNIDLRSKQQVNALAALIRSAGMCSAADLCDVALFDSRNVWRGQFKRAVAALTAAGYGEYFKQHGKTRGAVYEWHGPRFQDEDSNNVATSPDTAVIDLDRAETTFTFLPKIKEDGPLEEQMLSPDVEEAHAFTDEVLQETTMLDEFEDEPNDDIRALLELQLAGVGLELTAEDQLRTNNHIPLNLSTEAQAILLEIIAQGVMPYSALLKRQSEVFGLTVPNPKSLNIRLNQIGSACSDADVDWYDKVLLVENKKIRLLSLGKDPEGEQDFLAQISVVK